MPRPIAPLAAIAAIAIVALLLSVLGPAQLNGSDGHGSDAASFVRLRAGDRLQYLAGDESTWEVRVLAPRPVSAADLGRTFGLPLVLGVNLGNETVWDGHVLDTRHGGIAISVEGCLVDPTLPCSGPGDGTYVTWQECPLTTLFAPADLVSRAVASQPFVQVVDPVKGTAWTYRVTPAMPRLHFALEASPARTTCPMNDEVVVNVDTGLVEEIRRDALTLRLASAERGATPAIAIAAGRATASLFQIPGDARPHPYPPGAEGLGGPAWMLGDAWQHAASDSAEVRDFLRRHPSAFFLQAQHTSAHGEALDGTIQTAEHTWHFRVLGRDRALLEVASVKSVTQGVARYQTAATTATASEVPPDYQPPAKQAVDLMAFGRAARERGFVPEAGFGDLSFSVIFDGADADSIYQLALGGEQDDNGGRVVTRWVLLNADTGRLTDASLFREAAQSLLGPRP